MSAPIIPSNTSLPNALPASGAPRLFLWALVSALAGFLFGFDTVVISGAEKTIESLWQLSPQMHGWAMSSALWGMVLGSLIGGWPTDHWGRKRTLLSIGILFLVGSLWSAAANDVYAFMSARFVGGIAVGISTVAAPLYISEISPPGRRGRLAGMFQFNIVFGIVVAFFSNYLLEGIGENAWRWMLGIMAIPSTLYSLACFIIPESPRWLLARKGDRAQGIAVLKLIDPGASAAVIEERASALSASPVAGADARGFWSGKFKKPIRIAFFVAFFNQLSGINAILYFAPRIFGMTGSENALAQSIGIGITNLIFTFVGLYLIDRLGRRVLLYWGSFGYIISLGLCAWAFTHWAAPFKVGARAVELKETAGKFANATPQRLVQLQETMAKQKSALAEATQDAAAGTTPVSFAADVTPEAVKGMASNVLKQSSQAAGNGGLVVLIFIFAFIASHAIGQGAVIWVLISEIFPDKYRATGQALGSFTHWIFAALLTYFFPVMINAFPPQYVFMLFCGMMVLQLLWVKLMVPETKGVPLEEIQKQLGISA